MMPFVGKQRGAAALSVTFLLLFALTLAVAFANRNLIFEQRSSANQSRSTQAFEAAEAALAWGQAMLDGDGAIDARCEASSSSGNVPFRERFLAYDAASQRFEPRTWDNAGTPTPLQAACVRGDAGWSCSCPDAGHPVLDAPAASGTHPAFTLRFAASARSGMVVLLATGCDHFAATCLPGMAGTTASDASARLQVTLALLPALASRPSAALTARGDIVATGALALVNTGQQSDSALTAQAGGSIALPAASLTTRAGATTASSLAAHDADLAGLDAERLFSRLLGLDRTRWQQQPGVNRLTCNGDCSAELADAVGTHPLQWISGDLRLSGPLTIGATERPVLLVVDGQATLGNDVTIHGVIVSLATDWDTSATVGGQVHGAVVALGNIVGSGTPSITYDVDVLARLHGQTGSFVRVAGSWRDY